MTPISLRPTPPAPTSAPATADAAPAPGFAALLDAVREPNPAADPGAPSEADAPEAAAPDKSDARPAKAARKTPASPAKPASRDDHGNEAPAAIDVAALLLAKPVPTDADAASNAPTAETPVAATADAAATPLPVALPTPTTAPVPTEAEASTTAAPGIRSPAMPTPAERDAANAVSGPALAPDVSNAAPAHGKIERNTAPALEGAPATPSKADAHHRSPAANPVETAPNAMNLPAPQATPAAALPAAAAATPFTAHLAAALESPRFAPALAAQVRWLVEGGVQTAQLTLNPAEMGPVAVRIAVDGTQARIDFTAALAPTRAAIEASLPTLAASLADGGLTLAGGGVFDGSSPRQSPGDAQRGARPQATAVRGGAPDAAVRAPALPDRARGLVDLVA